MIPLPALETDLKTWLAAKPGVFCKIKQEKEEEVPEKEEEEVEER